MYGILVNPDPSQKMGAWFLHRCQHESQTFQCNPDPDTWYTFDSVEEAEDLWEDILDDAEEDGFEEEEGSEPLPM